MSKTYKDQRVLSSKISRLEKGKKDKEELRNFFFFINTLNQQDS